MGIASRLVPWFHRQRPGDDERLSYRVYKRAWQQLPEFSQPTLFDRIERTDWNLLIILDAARYDSLRGIADAVVSKEISPASSTPEFLPAVEEANIFADDYYVSASPQSTKRTTGAKHTEYLEEYWDDRLQTIPPGPVYDRASELVRNGKSVVAHTLQPHYPHICRINGDLEPVPGGFHPEEIDIRPDDVLQGYLTNGNYSLKDLQRSYEICLEFAWEEAKGVAQKLRQEGYTVAITADHGELFGEYGFVNHPTHVPVPTLRHVPWIKFTPPSKSAANKELDDVDDRLRALGYR